MQITKCDICKKEIDRNDMFMRVALHDEHFSAFEICSKCSGSIIKIFKNKKLIKDKKVKGLEKKVGLAAA